MIEPRKGFALPARGVSPALSLDERLAALGLFYTRFMDDWGVLAPTHWKLRRAIRVVNQTLTELKVAQHPDKTFIGRIARGFDFLGYRFSSSGLGIAPRTMERFAERMARLYWQGVDASRIGAYGQHWWRLVGAGVTVTDEWWPTCPAVQSRRGQA